MRRFTPAAPSDRLLRRARLAATAVGGFLVPWSAVLAKTLPAAHQSRRWNVAWAGLDAAEALAALTTSALLARGDRRAAVPAAAFGALVLADAWFDVVTAAPGREHAIAVAEAAAVEIPIAAAAFWLAATISQAPAAGQSARYDRDDREPRLDDDLLDPADI
jgi:hypothetical protein